MDILSAAAQGFGMLVTWPVFPAMLIGIVIGMCVGIIPGLGGLVGMALLLPFAIGQAPEVGFAFLLGMYAVTTQTDAIPAVLLGVPGTVSATATTVDGYPMTKRGEAGRALSASYMASIVGAALSGLVFIMILPGLRPIMLQFASPEFFMLSMLGLVMVGTMVSKAVFRGLLMAGVGLIIAMVGLSPGTGAPRLVFGQPYLWDGVPLIPLVMGLFAIPELVELASTRSTLSRTAAKVTDGKYSGFRDVLVHRWLVVRCSIIGTVVGAVPGLGGPVAEWFGYGHAMHSAKDSSQFGHGDVRGVIGPETATGAQKPGSIIPTIAFGIPGNPAMALILGVMIMVGLQPGPKMLAEDLDITFLLVWVVIIANIIAAGLALGLQPWLVRLCHVRPTVLVPIVLGFMSIGAATATGDRLDIVAFGIFGLIGILLKSSNWPRVPLIMGLVLGKIAEPYLFITVDRYGFGFMWDRPVVIIVEILMVLAVSVSIRKGIARKKQKAASADARPRPATGQPVLGLGFFLGVAMGIVGVMLVVWAWDMSLRERLFPTLVGSVVAICALLDSVNSIRKHLKSRDLSPTPPAAPILGRAWIAVGWVAALLLGSVLLGHMIAVPIFVFLYMILHGERPHVAVLAGVFSAAALHFVFLEWLQITLPTGWLLEMSR